MSQFVGQTALLPSSGWDSYYRPRVAGCIVCTLARNSVMVLLGVWIPRARPPQCITAPHHSKVHLPSLTAGIFVGSLKLIRCWLTEGANDVALPAHVSHRSLAEQGPSGVIDEDVQWACLFLLITNRNTRCASLKRGPGMDEYQMAWEARRR